MKEYLGKTDSALQTYYCSLVFTGKASMPRMLGADAEVVAYVAKTKGAIGYVSAAAGTAGNTRFFLYPCVSVSIRGPKLFSHGWTRIHTDKWGVRQVSSPDLSRSVAQY
jgi:hypothetical protein